jgi:hypothetical protein
MGSYGETRTERARFAILYYKVGLTQLARGWGLGERNPLIHPRKSAQVRIFYKE